MSYILQWITMNELSVLFCFQACPLVCSCLSFAEFLNWLVSFSFLLLRVFYRKHCECTHQNCLFIKAIKLCNTVFLSGVIDHIIKKNKLLLHTKACNVVKKQLNVFNWWMIHDVWCCVMYSGYWMVLGTIRKQLNNEHIPTDT